MGVTCWSAAPGRHELAMERSIVRPLAATFAAWALGYCWCSWSMPTHVGPLADARPFEVGGLSLCLVLGLSALGSGVLWWTWPGGVTVVGVTAMAAVGAVATVAWDPVAGRWPFFGSWLLTWAGVAAAFLIRRRVALMSWTALGFPALTLGAAPQVGDGVDVWISATGVVVGATWVGEYLGALGRTSDRLAQEAEALRLAELRRTAHARAGRRVRHLIHDEIISVLKVIVRGDAEVASVEAARALDVVARSSAALAATSGRDIKNRVGAPLGLEVRWTVLGRGTVPGIVAAAVVDAAREALRNVYFHASERKARVTVQCSNAGIRVRVTSRGPTWDVVEGSGLRAAREHLERVGGTLVIEVRPDVSAGNQSLADTRVSVAWNRETSRSPGRGGASNETFAGIDDRRLLTLVAVGPLAAQGLLAVRHGWESRWPWLVLAASGIYLGATWLLLCRMESKVPGRATIAIWMVGAPVTCGLGLWLAPPGAPETYAGFAIGLAQMPLTFLAFVLPLRLLPLLTVPYLGVVTYAIAVDPFAELHLSAAALGAAVMPAVAGSVLGWQIRRARGQVSARLVERRELQASETEERHIAGVVAAQFAAALDDVRPLLEKAARSNAYLDTMAREEALRTLHMLRDDLKVPGLSSPALRSRIAVMRDTGTTLRLCASLQGLRLTEADEAQLAMIFDHASRDSTITIGLDYDDPELLLVTVVPPIPVADTGPPGGPLAESDGWVTSVRWQHRPEETSHHEYV